MMNDPATTKIETQIHTSFKDDLCLVVRMESTFSPARGEQETRHTAFCGRAEGRERLEV